MNVRQTVLRVSAACIAMHGTFAAIAEDESGIPQHEREIAERQGFEGPAETQGIESSVMLGSIPLRDDFPALDGRLLRARVVTLLPGGTVQAHEHDARPGVAYILEGELIEYRNDSTVPIVRGPGDASFEKSGVVHWWINEGPEKARAIIVDIVREEPETE